MKTIALLGQPNSGKSTLYNGLTGSRQHVGNWPGKTVEKKEGKFEHNGETYAVIDLPGSYSLSANSDEEIITRNYIVSGKADLICMLIDASQLERSLFMLADFAGLNVPLVLLLNMMDVVEGQGKKIDSEAISKQLGIPVLPFVASDHKRYGSLKDTIEHALEEKPLLKISEIEKTFSSKENLKYDETKQLVSMASDQIRTDHWIAVKSIENDSEVLNWLKKEMPSETFAQLEEGIDQDGRGGIGTGSCKFAFIQGIIGGVVTSDKKRPVLSKFDRIATSPRLGKGLAVIAMVLALVLSMIVAMPIMGIGMLIPQFLSPALYTLMNGIGAPDFLEQLIAVILPNILFFAISMAGFVLGVTFVFSAMEESGYLARISFVFDSLMAKLGLQGKTICSFLMGFGCTIAGATGTRVIDNWGQRILAMSLVWSVPCGATWALMPTLAVIFFGYGAIFVMLGILLFMVISIIITARIFGNRLAPKSERTGMIMELPPYHRPKMKHVLRNTLAQGGNTFVRAIKVISIISLVFFFLSYSKDGQIENSLIYMIGEAIEPFTKLLGLSWQTFMAFIASGLSKEAVVGVLGTLYAGGGDIVSSTFGAKEGVDANSIATILTSAISKPEALAFIFATTFNVPCIIALTTTYHENHSIKWTLIIAVYYTAMALVLAGLVYHISSLFF